MHEKKMNYSIKTVFFKKKYKMQNNIFLNIDLFKCINAPKRIVEPKDPILKILFLKLKINKILQYLFICFKNIC